MGAHRQGVRAEEGRESVVVIGRGPRLCPTLRAQGRAPALGSGTPPWPSLIFHLMLVEVEVLRLGMDRATSAYVVILREKGGDRLLPIWIGQAEAESIMIEMHQMHRERPLTHDLCKNLIVQLGATLRRVQITRVASRTYYAELHLASRDGSVVVDARPSDSIAIGIRFGAPLFANDALLSNAVLEEAEADVESEPAPEPGPMSGEQLKAYLENLRPEDFGKFTL